MSGQAPRPMQPVPDPTAADVDTLVDMGVLPEQPIPEAPPETSPEAPTDPAPPDQETP